MENLHLHITYGIYDVLLVETTAGTPIGHGMLGTLLCGESANGHSAKEQINTVVFVYSVDGEEVFTAGITPVSLEKNEKVLKIRDTNNDQWVFAFQR